MNRSRQDGSRSLLLATLSGLQVGLLRLQLVFRVRHHQPPPGRPVRGLLALAAWPPVVHRQRLTKSSIASEGGPRILSGLLGMGCGSADHDIAISG